MLRNDCKRQQITVANHAIAKVAKQNGKSIEQIRAAMTEAIENAYHCPDPSAQSLWAQVPREGQVPTPEELILWVVSQLSQL
ncbi:MAG: hypothetical protein E7437_04715 [Ruminococcaceae bacterium]|nr:hypothetical protein [Oscillospiraceae bacterium]